MMRKLIFSMALLLTVGVASAQVKFEDVSTTELRDMAKAQEKLVFIDVYATWCPPCRAMESNVFSREDVGEFMSARFVSAKYNLDVEPGKSIASTYSITSIPTYLVLNEKGELVGRMQGSMPAEDFMANLNTLLEMANK